LLAALQFFTLSSLVVWYFVFWSVNWIIEGKLPHRSQWIYVLVSFIFFKGLLTKYYRLVALSLTVIILYGGMLWYIFPKG
jgi:hypothetical protein